MHQKDYIIYLIEQFGRMVARIIGAIEQREFSNAEFMIEEVYRNYLGLNRDLVSSIHYESLIQMLSIDPDQAEQKVRILADTFVLEAKLLLNSNQIEAADLRYKKALKIYFNIIKAHENVDEASADQNSPIRDLLAYYQRKDPQIDAEIQNHLVALQNHLNRE